MKKLIVILLLLGTLPSFAQKKKKVDPRDEQIDTLTKVNTALSAQLDSVSKNYNGLYATIKDKVFLQDYDPARLPVMIDSMRTSRDSVSSMQSVPLKDSLAQMRREIGRLQSQIDSMHVSMQKHAASSVDKAKLTAELKDLKALLDTKVITQAEFDAKKKLVLDRWQ
ncbi:MAG: SHOCT domain-containing protein [Flavisolibacter sp.]